MVTKTKTEIKTVLMSRWFIAIAALIIGMFVMMIIRFATYSPAGQVHYHANFALYINGQREEFKNPFYYLDVEESCTTVSQVTPHERAHMHDGINSVVHVEDQAVTWGQFFQNIGWIVDNRVLITPTQNLPVTDTNKVMFILNSKQTDNVINQVIGDQDRLLVDYGNTSESVLHNEYKTVPTTAHKYDISQDPKSCSGHKTTTMHDRLVHMF